MADQNEQETMIKINRGKTAEIVWWSGFAVCIAGSLLILAQLFFDTTPLGQRWPVHILMLGAVMVVAAKFHEILAQSKASQLNHTKIYVIQFPESVDSSKAMSEVMSIVYANSGSISGWTHEDELSLVMLRDERMTNDTSCAPGSR